MTVVACRKLADMAASLASAMSTNTAAQQSSEEQIQALKVENIELRNRLDTELCIVKEALKSQHTGVDLTKLQTNLHNLSRHIDEQEVVVKHIQNKDVVRLEAGLFEVTQAMEGSQGMRDMDIQFADVMKLLERDVEMLKKKLSGGLASAMGADLTALSGVARQTDLLEVLSVVEHKADRGEVQKMIKKAVSLAVSAMQASVKASEPHADAVATPGRALKFRCLSCDQDVDLTQPRRLGKLPSPQGYLPNMERFSSVRPTTASSLGPSGPGLNAATFRQQQMEANGGGVTVDSDATSSSLSPVRSRPTTASSVPLNCGERATATATPKRIKSAARSRTSGPPSTPRTPVFS